MITTTSPKVEFEGGVGAPELLTIVGEVESSSRIDLPEGLSLEIFNAAADAISRWDDGHGELEDLVVELYRLMKMEGARAI
jgi:hypothetical protein